MPKHLLTIIIVTYNAEKFLENAIKSLIFNGYELCDIIVIDGKSTDSTLEIISKYQSFFSKIISEKDEGIYDAMNKGITYAKGNFIYFLGADDEINIPYQRLSTILIKENTIYYGNIIEKETNKIKGGKFNLFKLMNRNLYHQGMFYSANIFREYTFDTKFSLLADYVLNLNLWASKKYNFEFINYQIAKYSIKGKSSSIIDIAFKKDNLKLVYKLFGFKGILIKSLNPIMNILYKYEK